MQQVEVIKTAIKNTTVKKAARKKRAGYGDENIEPPTVTRTSSRRRVISKVTHHLHSTHPEWWYICTYIGI